MALLRDHGGGISHLLVNEESPIDASRIARARTARELIVGSTVRITLKQPVGRLTIPHAEEMLKNTNPFCRYDKAEANVQIQGEDGSQDQVLTFTIKEITPMLKEALQGGKLEMPHGYQNREPGHVQITLATETRKTVTIFFQEAADDAEMRDNDLNEWFDEVGAGKKVAPLWTNTDRTRYNGFLKESILAKILKASTDEEGVDKGTAIFSESTWKEITFVAREMEEVVAELPTTVDRMVMVTGTVNLPYDVISKNIKELDVQIERGMLSYNNGKIGGNIWLHMESSAAAQTVIDRGALTFDHQGTTRTIVFKTPNGKSKPKVGSRGYRNQQGFTKASKRDAGGFGGGADRLGYGDYRDDEDERQERERDTQGGGQALPINATWGGARNQNASSMSRGQQQTTNPNDARMIDAASVQRMINDQTQHFAFLLKTSVTAVNMSNSVALATLESNVANKVTHALTEVTAHMTGISLNATQGMLDEPMGEAGKEGRQKIRTAAIVATQNPVTELREKRPITDIELDSEEMASAKTGIILDRLASFEGSSLFRASHSVQDRWEKIIVGDRPLKQIRAADVPNNLENSKTSTPPAPTAASTTSTPKAPSSAPTTDKKKTPMPKGKAGQGLNNKSKKVVTVNKKPVLQFEYITSPNDHDDANITQVPSPSGSGSDISSASGGMISLEEADAFRESLDELLYDQFRDLPAVPQNAATLSAYNNVLSAAMNGPMGANIVIEEVVKFVNMNSTADLQTVYKQHPVQEFKILDASKDLKKFHVRHDEAVALARACFHHALKIDMINELSDPFTAGVFFSVFLQEFFDHFQVYHPEKCQTSDNMDLDTYHLVNFINPDVNLYAPPGRDASSGRLEFNGNSWANKGTFMHTSIVRKESGPNAKWWKENGVTMEEKAGVQTGTRQTSAINKEDVDANHYKKTVEIYKTKLAAVAAGEKAEGYERYAQHKTLYTLALCDHYASTTEAQMKKKEPKFDMNAFIDQVDCMFDDHWFPVPFATLEKANTKQETVDELLRIEHEKSESTEKRRTTVEGKSTKPTSK